MSEHRLTRWEATSLMVGAGVGAGIMAVPYLAERVGLVGLVLILPVAWAASVLVHLMLAEVLFRTGRHLQVVELMRLYVMRGRVGRWLLWAVFVLLSVAFLANLAAYISGAGEIVADLTGLPGRVAEVLVYVVSAGVVFFGLKAVGVAERFGALVLGGLALAIGAGAAGVPFRLAPAGGGGTSAWLALYGMVMYAYWTFYSVPQVVKGLAPDARGAVRAIMVGLGINGVLTALVAIVALGVSAEVTEVAIIGISAAIGPWAATVGSVLIVAALVTSYWSVSLALADIVHERTGASARVAWLAATLPSLLVLWLGVWQFLEWLRLAAGATALVLALITLPMYREARRSGEVRDPAWTLGVWGSPVALGFALVALLLMAVGSVVSVG
ncbi:MAG: aromatic amino acid transport family protein [Coriobacteriia bacterium]|nr:aromatic amino acid transport family protein [Coriobacteriia bacterium]